MRVDTVGVVWIALAAGWGLAQFGSTPDPPRLVVLLLASWFVGALFLALSYGRRWGGGLRDVLPVAAVLWTLMSLPSLSQFVAPTGTGLAFLFAPGYAALLAWGFRRQGRYAYSKRDLPELEGESRAAAEAVIRKAGLFPAAILVGPFPTFNAVVSGLRRCIVVIDRRASLELPAAELSALVAHEAGHLKRGDMFLYLSIAPLAMLAGLVADAVAFPSDFMIPVALSLYVGVGAAIRQAAELRADRFGAMLTRPEDVAAMLKHVHGDLPLSLLRTIRSPVLAPFVSHPPVDVRLAALETPPGRRLRGHVAALAVQLASSVTPMGIVLLSPDPRPALVWGAAAVTLTPYVLLIVMLVFHSRRSFGIASSGTRGGHLSRPLNWISAATTGAFALILVLGGEAPGLAAGLILSAVLTFGSFAIGLWGRLMGAGLASLTPRLREALVEASAAAHEGRAEVGLERLARVPAKFSRHAWYRSALGECLMMAGRLDEARAALEEAVREEPEFILPAFQLSLVLLLQGRAPEALKLIDKVCASAPNDPAGWRARGLIGLEVGALREARESMARACALKPADAATLGGAALIAMEEGAPDSDVEARLAEAERAGPKTPPVLLAKSRRLAGLARAEESRAALQESFDQLEKSGLRVWIPFYQSLARRWGAGDPSSS